MSLVYHKVENLTPNDSDGSISRKVAPSGIFQATNAINTINQLKWNSYPKSSASLIVFLQFVDEVTHPIHLHALHTFSCEVHHETR
jgi:hypothetical protein